MTSETVIEKSNSYKTQLKPLIVFCMSQIFYLWGQNSDIVHTKSPFVIVWVCFEDFVLHGTLILRATKSIRIPYVRKL